MAFGRADDVVRRHQIVPRLDPAAPVALGTADPHRALADQIDLTVPLTMAAADRAELVQLAAARAARDAVERVGVLGAGAVDDVGCVGHGEGPFRRGGRGEQARNLVHCHRSLVTVV